MADTENKTVLTQQDVLDYLGIDYVDDMIKRNIDRTILTADYILRGSIGKDYPVEDPRVKELALIIAGDLYDNRGLTVAANVSANTRKLVDDMSLQLRLELRRSKNGETLGSCGRYSETEFIY